jgi:hypothetical protein
MVSWGDRPEQKMQERSAGLCIQDTLKADCNCNRGF